VLPGRIVSRNLSRCACDILRRPLERINGQSLIDGQHDHPRERRRSRFSAGLLLPGVSIATAALTIGFHHLPRGQRLGVSHLNDADWAPATLRRSPRRCRPTRRCRRGVRRPGRPARR
jgi:hypothetical protein